MLTKNVNSSRVAWGLMALLLFGLTGCGGNEPKDVVRDFIYAVDEGNTTEAVGYFSSSLKAKVPERKLRGGIVEMQSDLSEQGGVKEVEILEQTIEGTTATVRARLITEQGEGETETTKLVKEDGEWKMRADK